MISPKTVARDNLAARNRNCHGYLCPTYVDTGDEVVRHFNYMFSACLSVPRAVTTGSVIFYGPPTPGRYRSRY